MRVEKQRKKVIFYGAGTYACDNFIELSKQYLPLCFCDRAAVDGQTLFGLDVLQPIAMFDKYPNVPILITLLDRNRIGVQSWLTEEMNIPAERILNYEEYGNSLGCWYLENNIILKVGGTAYASFCCSSFDLEAGRHPKILFNSDDTASELIRKTLAFRKKLMKELEEGTECVCKHCKATHNKGRQVKNKKAITTAEFRFVQGCNADCYYCNAVKEKIGVVDIDMYRECVAELKNAGVIDENTRFNIASGEITTFPQRKEYLDILAEYKCLIYSNCILYDEALASHLALGKSKINCSIDAGTRETYAKIKRVDCFDQVCESLNRYAKLAPVTLKYIFLQGINDNDADIDGFIRLARKIHAHDVSLSRDSHEMQTPLSDYTLMKMAEMRGKAINSGLSVIVSNSIFTKDEAVRFQNIVRGREDAIL